MPALPDVRGLLPRPPRWLSKYDEFVTKNASQVSQIESALRSLTYIIPGRFRDAELASESVHSGVQLLSLYHDTLLLRAASTPKLSGLLRSSSLHSRYTQFWARKSSLYQRVALALQVVQYTELLCEMAAKRRGERIRWRVVVLIEAIKAICRLFLLRITRSRPLVTPALPERQPVPEEPTEDGDGGDDSVFLVEGEEDEEEEEEAAAAEEKKAGANGHANGGGHGSGSSSSGGGGGGGGGRSSSSSSKEWTMPRTGMALPALPQPGDTSSYLLSRVLTADDIRPATKLLNKVQGSAQVAEMLHILAPLVYVVLLSRRRDKKTWTPWLVGFAMEYAARQLRDRSLRTTALERDEWAKRGWSMCWWAMRGPLYENVTKGFIGGVRARMPGLVAGIIEDYEYLWENYHFSTSS